MQNHLLNKFYKSNPTSEQFGLYNPSTEEQVPLYFIDINANIFTKFAKVNLTHKYFNPTENGMDTVFKFPKGLNQIFDAMEVGIDGVRLQSLILSTRIAEQKFQEAVKEGKLAAKTEEVHSSFSRNSDLMITKIGNIPPMKGVDITFSFIQKIDVSRNKYFHFRLPLTLTPKYIPNEIMLGLLSDYVLKSEIDYNTVKAIEDSEIRFYKSESGLEYRYSAQVNLHSDFVIKNVKSSMNGNLIISKTTEHHAFICLDNTVLNIPREDFCFEYEIEERCGREPLGMLEKHPIYDEYSIYYSFNPYYNYLDTGSKEFIEPASTIIEEFNGEFVFLIDRSCSMCQAIHTAKTSLLYFLKSLPNSAYFNVISFGSDYEPGFKESVQVSDENLEKAIEEVSEFTANMGGTELLNAIKYLKASQKGQKKITRVFIITDGAVFNEREVLEEIENSADHSDTQFFSLGIGDGCSESLVKGVALYGSGEYEFSKNENDLSDKVISLGESSMKEYGLDFKLGGDNTSKIILTNMNDARLKSKVKKIDKNIEFHAIIPGDSIQGNVITCSYLLRNPFFPLRIFRTEIDGKKAMTNSMLHKVCVNEAIISKYYTDKDELREISEKYQLLSKVTSGLCVASNTVLTQQEGINKTKVEIKNLRDFNHDIELNIRGLTGKYFNVSLSPFDTVLVLKECIESAEGIPVDQQRVIFQGCQLENHLTISDYSIQNHSLIHLVLRLRGGGGGNFAFRITIDGVEKELFEISDMEQWKKIPYPAFIKQVYGKYNLKEEEYDFVSTESGAKNSTGPGIAFTKKVNVGVQDKISSNIYDKFVRTQKASGGWEISTNTLMILGEKRLSEFILNYKEKLKHGTEDADEFVLFNMIIVSIIMKGGGSEINGRFKLILRKSQKALKAIFPKYSNEMQGRFNLEVSFTV